MYISIISALVIAILFTLILSFAFRRSAPGPVNGVLFIFFILFLFSWSIGGWIEPVTSYQIDYPWLSYLIIGFFVMLLLGALLPPSHPRSGIAQRVKVDEDLKTDQAIGVTIGLFFWVMLIVLIIVGVVRWI